MGRAPAYAQQTTIHSEDPVMEPYKVAGRLGQAPGYAGPAGKQAIIVDMYAKAIQGMPAEDVVKWAGGELKTIYS